MVTDKHNKYLSDKVYDVNSKNEDERVRVNAELKEGFKVLAVENNKNNGMQAMAVAPVDSNGEVDTSKIVISYAGTDFNDQLDIATDIQQVVFGEKYRLSALKEYRRATQRESQVATAEKFAEKIKNEYPYSDISTTGHSLGGYLASYIAILNKWSTTVYNAPDASNILSEKDIEWANLNKGRLVNYRNRKDPIGNFGRNKLGIAIYVDSDMSSYGLLSGLSNIFSKYHTIYSWEKYDKEGNLLDKDGKIARETVLKEVDVENDGKVDFRLDSRNLVEEPLFSAKYINKVNGGIEIIINYESLKYLSNQLNKTINDLNMALDILNRAEKYNNELSNKKENRKESLEQYVLDHLQQLEVVNAIVKIDKLFNDIDDNIVKYSRLGKYNPKNFSNQFKNSGKDLWVEEDEHPFDYNSVEVKLSKVVDSSNEVVRIIKSNISGGFVGAKYTMLQLNIRSEIAKHGESIINSFKDKIRDSFKGESNRSSFDDGIVDALKEVIRVEKANIQMLINCFQYMNSAVQMTAYSFNRSDTDLGNKLKINEEVVGNYQAPTLASDYNTFLNHSNVFDDVAVVKAFDNQVDTRTEELSGEMISKLGYYFESVASSIKSILNSLLENESYIENVVQKFPTQIYLKTIGSKDKKYYGSVESSISEADLIKEVGEISKGIEEKHSRLLSDLENVASNLPRLQYLLEGSLEELIYGYDNLSGILNAHNLVSDILKKINKQAAVFNSLLRENKGQTIEQAGVRLEEILNITNNVNTMIDDCFGK